MARSLFIQPEHVQSLPDDLAILSKFALWTVGWVGVFDTVNPLLIKEKSSILISLSPFTSVPLTIPLTNMAMLVSVPVLKDTLAICAPPSAGADIISFVIC